MEVAATARLLLESAVWRMTGLRAAGRVLVRALGSPDPGVRTTAAMLLAKGGRAAESLLLEAVRARESLPLAVTILADVGGAGVEPVLAELAADRDPEVATAARQGLRVLAERVRR
jgi:hypothetical protein